MKTEALDVMKNRRSIRKYKADQVPTKELEMVLEAGTYAPNAGGKQAFVIVAVQDPETVAQLDRMNAKVLAKTTGKDPSEFNPYYGAPTILIVLATEGDAIRIQDCSAVACNLVNAAYAVGLASCWVHRSKDIFESEEGKALLQKWGLPEDLHGVVSVALGYADCEYPAAPPRREGITLIV